MYKDLFKVESMQKPKRGNLKSYSNKRASYAKSFAVCFAIVTLASCGEKTGNSMFQTVKNAADAYYIAIERTRKIVLPDYPEFQLVYQSDNLLSIGATRKNVQGYDIPIFDMERSVCDAIKYRNKVGIDVMAEILQTYLRRPDKNISRLMDYASKLRIRKTLNQYLEVWQ